MLLHVAGCICRVYRATFSITRTCRNTHYVPQPVEHKHTRIIRQKVTSPVTGADDRKWHKKSLKYCTTADTCDKLFRVQPIIASSFCKNHTVAGAPLPKSLLLRVGMCAPVSTPITTEIESVTFPQEGEAFLSTCPCCGTCLDWCAFSR